MVADLSHHDGVRVLAQDVLQHLGETQSDRFADRVLVDVVQLVFHRVLDRDDVLLYVVQIIEGRVQRGGLAAAGGAADQDQSIAVAEQFLEQLQIGLPHAELLDIEDRLILVQHPQHDLFTVDAGQRAEAQVDGAPLRHDLNASVLRHAPLRDIQVAHDLEAGNDRRVDIRTQRQHFVKQTVDAETDHRSAASWLDVNVARAIAHRPLDQAVDEVDDRAPRRQLVDRAEIGRHLLDQLQIGGKVLHQLRGELVAAVGLELALGDFFEPRQHQPQLAARDFLDLVQN